MEVESVDMKFDIDFKNRCRLIFSCLFRKRISIKLNEPIITTNCSYIHGSKK